MRWFAKLMAAGWMSVARPARRFASAASRAFFSAQAASRSTFLDFLPASRVRLGARPSRGGARGARSAAALRSSSSQRSIGAVLVPS